MEPFDLLTNNLDRKITDLINEKAEKMMSKIEERLHRRIRADLRENHLIFEDERISEFVIYRVNTVVETEMSRLFAEYLFKVEDNLNQVVKGEVEKIQATLKEKEEEIPPEGQTLDTFPDEPKEPGKSWWFFW